MYLTHAMKFLNGVGSMGIHNSNIFKCWCIHSLHKFKANWPGIEFGGIEEINHDGAWIIQKLTPWGAYLVIPLVGLSNQISTKGD